MAVALPNRPEHLKPVLAREQDVEQHQVVVPAEGASLASFTVRRAIHGVPRRSQASLDELGDCRLVFDDQDPHASRL